MKYNEYKKYYDKVSPNQKLIEETKAKMFEELESSQERNITFMTTSRRYIAAAACFVLIGATLAIVPNLSKMPVGNNIPEATTTTTIVVTQAVVDETISYSESISTTTQPVGTTYIKYDTTVSSELVDTVISSTSDTLPVQSITTYSQTQAVSQTQSVGEVTQTPVSKTEVQVTTVSDKVTTQSNESVSSEVTEVTTISTVSQVSEITTLPVTTTKNYKPGVTEPSTEITTTVSHSISVEDNYYVEEIAEIGDVCINRSYDYEFLAFSSVSFVTRDDASEFFDAIPKALVDGNEDIVGIVQQYDNTFKNGVGFNFISDTGKEIFLSLGKGHPVERYKVYGDNLQKNVINDCEYFITQVTKYSDVYICTFTKNDMYYNFKFEGYTPAEIFKILLS